jgi:hypothetical protein
MVVVVNLLATGDELTAHSSTPSSNAEPNAKRTSQIGHWLIHKIDFSHTNFMPLIAATAIRVYSSFSLPPGAFFTLFSPIPRSLIVVVEAPKEERVNLAICWSRN